MKTLAILFSLVLYCGSVNAQEAFTNNGNLQIHPGASIAGFGNFLNASTSALVNNGSLYVRGSATNNQSSMAIGTGTLYFNGIALQAVNGTQPFRTFNLVTNNTSGITINNNLSVSGAHTYTNGIINTSVTPHYLIYEAGSSYSGDADSRHVNGWVKKIGNTNFSFPVGNGIVIRKAAIESLSGSLEFNAKYEAPTASTSVQLPLISVDPNEYWIINRVNGSGSAQVHMNWDNSKVGFPQYILMDIRAAYYTGGFWTDQGGSATGNVTTTGDITSNSVSSFGSFTMGSISGVIPLQFLGITAQRKGGYNLVEWRTASAISTDHFDIERSEDGVHFKKMGSMVSYNSPSAMSYFFKDVHLTGGTLWYRIRSVDTDDKFKLSPIVWVKEVEQTHPSMYVLNNPAQGSIHLFAPDSYKGRCDYYIVHANGQLMQQGTMAVKGSGNIFIKLDAGISPGVYMLQVKNGQKYFQEKIMVR